MENQFPVYPALSPASTLVDRVRYLIKLSRLTQAKFARRISMDPANLSKILAGHLNATDGFVNRIVVEMGVSKNWLKTGEGTPFNKAEETEESAGSRIKADDNVDRKGTPLYDIDVTAGTFELSTMLTNDNIIGCVDLPRISKDSSLVKVTGDSMTPVIDDGAFIAIRHIISPENIFWGQIYVVHMPDYRMVKYIRKHSDPEKLILHSANPDYDDMEINRKDIISLYMVEAVINYRLF